MTLVDAYSYRFTFRRCFLQLQLLACPANSEPIVLNFMFKTFHQVSCKKKKKCLSSSQSIDSSLINCIAILIGN